MAVEGAGGRQGSIFRGRERMAEGGWESGALSCERGPQAQQVAGEELRLWLVFARQSGQPLGPTGELEGGARLWHRPGPGGPAAGHAPTVAQLLYLKAFANLLQTILLTRDQQ